MINSTWDLIERYDDFVCEAEFTDAEIIAIFTALQSIINVSQEDVYSRALDKLHPAFDRAVVRDAEDRGESCDQVISLLR